MKRIGSHRPTTARLFATYAVVSLVPVLVLGLALAQAIRHQADQRGLAEGRSEAVLVAQTAVEPELAARPLRSGLTASEHGALQRLVKRAVRERHVLRLRVRDLAGRVVFSDDGSGFKSEPEDEALDAARGRVVARLTRLNSDINDVGPAGVAAVEVYLPLTAGTPAHRVGVLEVYLPYAPIERDIQAGMQALYRDLVIGLGVLYLALFAITASVSRGLRREVALNAFLAEHDTLTELPNRTLFHRRATAVVAESRRGRAAAIAIVDLDRFKEVNDTLGHHNGDLLLTELGRNLAATMRPGDTVARLGGDEFGLIVRDVADAEPVLWRLRALIDHEVEISGLPLSVEASIGFVVIPEDGTDVDTLIQHADVAMYAAKSKHAGVVRYEPSLDRFDAASLSRVSKLRRAIDADELVLHYQPLATLADRKVVAVEALVRWQHPTDGLLYPDQFLPLAEQTDVIDKLTSWVLRTAARQILQLAPDADLTVAVNVSARSLGKAAFADEVIAILEQTGLPPTRLIIEVTETALLVDPRRAANVLQRLSAAGVRVSLDDFGSGQTSLAYLSTLPLDELKIDRSFVFDMLDNPANAAIVRSIIDLGHNLDLRVVGEGVETNEVLAGLHASGCDIAQGYLLARPMPAERLHEWIAHQALVTRPAAAT
jgi:diguanylate cyclase (GGDEF)-like protein